uniref:ubiquitinyl hydrolase 1 n=1 Tax=Astyanax mexicanus TaxID=7994 RepID=A0A8B9RBX2_ASTMX
MEEVESAEELLVKEQRREKKELQAKIQSMKNAVPKNDKKRRKQLTEDIAKLEAELSQKHENELKLLQTNSNAAEKEVSNAVNSINLSGGEQADGKQPRVTKAQKRRDKKAAQEKERENRIAEAELENLLGSRHQEGLKLKQKLTEKHLQIKEISSDGHCMYRAVEDQLLERGRALGIQELRAQTAQYMRSHSGDFLPFLTNPNTGDMYTEEEFEKYCSDVAETAAWGGQLEVSISFSTTYTAWPKKVTTNRNNVTRFISIQCFHQDLAALMMVESDHCTKPSPSSTSQRFSMGLRSGLCGEQSMCENRPGQ